ncbi:unnamed protein product [Rhizopus stolonifer]
MSSTMNHSVCQFSESSFYVTDTPEIKTESTFSHETVDSQQFKTSFYNPFEIKRRKRTTRTQFKVLESTFLENPKPNAPLRRYLARELDMTPRGVQVWFQNRRAKEKVTTKKPHVRQMSLPVLDEEELLMTPITPIVDINWDSFQWPMDNKIPPHVSYFTTPLYDCYLEPRMFEPRLFDPIFDPSLTFFNQYDLIERRHTL